MKKQTLYGLVLLVFLLTACTTIPQESVDLSAEVGIGLQRQHQSEVDLINLYFENKRESLDEAMERALDKYFATLTPSGSITLNKSQLKDIAADVTELNARNNAAKEELEKARILLMKKLNENYLLLNQANASVTGLLQSVVTVKGARSEAFQSLCVSRKAKMDLANLFSEVDEFVLKGGKEAGKAIKLVEKLKLLLSRRQK